MGQFSRMGSGCCKGGDGVVEEPGQRQEQVTPKSASLGPIDTHECVVSQTSSNASTARTVRTETVRLSVNRTIHYASSPAAGFSCEFGQG